MTTADPLETDVPAADAPHGSAIIGNASSRRHRCPSGFVERPRLDRLVSGLLRTAQLVWVCGTAGSGKTTAVLHATRRDERPLAWLTLNDSDCAPGRLVTYLEAALSRVPAATVADVATSALGRRVPHAEAAGLLAEAADGPLVVVIDEVERAAASQPALAVLEQLCALCAA